jgi:hypothetical protein
MNKLFRELVQECCEDYVGLWTIVRQVREDVADESMVFETVIALIERLITEGGAVAGDFRGEEFFEWKLPVSAVLKEVERQWRALDRDPTIGEVVWLTAKRARSRTG